MTKSTQSLDVANPVGRAAVLIAVAGEGLSNSRLLLTRRSERMTSHRGEVALPGGKWEPGDASLQATALREAHEEVGLAPSLVKNIRALPVQTTRLGTQVAPFFANVPEIVTLTPCPVELESLFWVPVELLQSDSRSQTDIFTVAGKEYWAPVYHYEGYKIWGFTARLLVDAMNRFYGAGITRVHRAKEVAFGRPGQPAQPACTRVKASPRGDESELCPSA
ncbi:MAG TPA: CoA pyrophosphatase [Marinagarivorans sp.]